MRKLISIVLITCLLLAMGSTLFAQEMSVGDLNGDGRISLVDVIISAKYVLADTVSTSADLDSSGDVGLTDTVLLAKVVLGVMDISQVDVQVISSTTTLQQHERPTYSTDKTVRVELARGESEAAQFTVYSNSRTYRNMRVDVSELTSADGNTVQAKLSREDFHVVDYKWTYGKIDVTDAEKTAWVLLPTEIDDYNCVTTVAGENTAYQLDITTQQDTPAGEYVGQITITHDCGQIILPVTVTVWDFELPQVPTFRTLFGYWSWMTSGYTHYTGEKLQQTIMDSYALAGEYKIALSSLPPVIADADDPQAYAKDVREWIDANPTQTAYIIPFYHSSNNGLWYVDDDDAQRNENLYRALEEYGVLDRAYIYANDEPHSEEQRYNMEVVGNYLIESGWNDKVHNIVPITNMGEMYGTTNTWCPLTGTIDFERAEQVMQETGAEMWWYYIADGPCTGLHLEKDQSQIRMQGWFARQHNITGGLHWLMNMYAYYIDNPNSALTPGYYYDDVNIFGIGNAAQLILGMEGDGYLNRDIVVPTMLMASMRDSIEDYDYLVLLEQRVQEFLNRTGIDMTLQEAMEAYYSGLSVAFDEYATYQSPENIPTMRRDIADTIVNGTDYILMQKTVSNGYRYDQKEFTVYVSPGTEASIDGAELMKSENFDSHDMYTFLYTHKDKCEFMTLRIGDRTHVRPVQMSLTITGQPQTLIDFDNPEVQQKIIECNPGTDIRFETVDEGTKLVLPVSAGETFLEIPESILSISDISDIYTHLCMCLQTDTACQVSLLFETDTSILPVYEDTFTQPYTGESISIFPSDPSMKQGIRCSYICVNADSSGGEVSFSNIKLIQMPDYQ